MLSLAHHNKELCDLIIVIGGDGSFLGASQIAIKSNIPIIGINCGGLGFLTDISSKKIEIIKNILNGKYIVDTRDILSVNKTNKKYTRIAINDIVILPFNSGNIIQSKIFINDIFLCQYKSDGLIIATPTGSTAYALSNGGPIIHPKSNSIIIMPILSHNLSSRPIIINNNDYIKIIFTQSNCSDLVLLCDGQTRIPFKKNDIIKVCKSDKSLSILHPLNYNYFDVLRKKLKWENVI